MKIGIDRIGFYTPPLYIEMEELAEVRGVDPGKYIHGIGQSQMAVTPLSQDIVSMAANAALQILSDNDKEAIDLIIVGTESGFDASKSAAAYVHRILGIQPHTRSMEVKHACYGATAGIQMAIGHIARYPEKKALVIGTDIARYGLSSGGEVTQGSGAVAMIISANPSILTFEGESGYLTKDIMDFWRPVYSSYAMVDGKYSNEQYLAFFQEVWNLYREKNQRNLDDMNAICFHLPYTKMGKKALQTILDEASEEKQAELLSRYESSIALNRNVGNIYTGSLYLSLLSLLVNDETIATGDRVGLFSYGSGAVGEFFGGTLEQGFRDQLPMEEIRQLFADRKKISVSEYEDLFMQILPEDGTEVVIAGEGDPSFVRLTRVSEHKRTYSK